MFTPLHIKSAHSLLQSPFSVADYIKNAKAKGYRYVVLNEYETLSSALLFYQLAKQHDLIPIVAVSFVYQTVEMSAFATTQDAYFELVDLSSRLLGEDKLTLDLSQYQHIMLTINNVSLTLLSQIDTLSQQINCPLYVIQKDFSSDTQQLLSRCQLPVLLSKQTDYLEKTDNDVLQVLDAIKQNTLVMLDTVNQQAEHYLLESDYYQQWCLQNETAYEMTRSFFEQANLHIPTQQMLLPTFDTNANERLKQVAYEGLMARGLTSEVYQKRLAYELDVIAKMGFSDYFLIVWDVMSYAHQTNIMTGAGRGSSAASLVSYCLRITNVDPIKYNLLFERFLNPNRQTMPDIDLDFPDNKRQDILSYVARKYGQNNVAQIATFGTFAPKQAIRDVARVFGATTQELKTWAIATRDCETLQSPTKALRELAQKTKRHALILEIAQKIENLPRHLSTHAAGVVISDKPLNTLIPVQKRENQLLLTQFEMGDVQQVGLLKMDFLGLKNLSILADAVSFVQEQQPQFNIWDIDFNDSRTLQLFAKGQTDGVFQFESGGIKRVLKQVKPDRFEEVAIVNALYRPGPMAQITQFVNRKFKKEPVIFMHEKLQPILQDTQGIIVYQEQVMLIANILAGYSIGQADLLRRAIAKMDQTIMANEKIRFIEGAIKQGYDEQLALEVFQYIEQFANYGFPKSHAFAYSVLAYQLAYLKAHFPQAFYLALLLHTNTKSERYSLYITQARQYGVTFSLPSINHSRYQHSITQDGVILFGLSAISGLRSKNALAILEERYQKGKFIDFDTFIDRIDSASATIDTIEPMIYSGCFDEFGETRASLLARLNAALENRQFLGGALKLTKQDLPELPLDELIEGEKNHLGFSFSQGVDLVKASWYDKELLQRSIDVTLHDIVSCMGVLRSIRKITTKNNKRMAFATLDDTFGVLNMTIFPDVYQKYFTQLDNGKTVYITGKIEHDLQGEVVCIIQELLDEQEATIKLNNSMKRLFVKIEASNQLQLLYNTLQKYSGHTPVIVYDTTIKQYQNMSNRYAVNPTIELLTELELLFGKENVVLKTL